MGTARRQLGYVSSLTQQTSFVAGYGTATGGSSSSTITVSGQQYTMLTFTATALLTVTKAGLFDVFLMGGGGASGNSDTGEDGSGGGGGGGWREATLYLDSNQTITIGAGLAGATNSGAACGEQTYIGDILMALGGGRGGTYDYFMNGSNAIRAGNGGGQNSHGPAGATAWAGGNAGGSSSATYDYYRAGGGGGGAGGVGGNGNNTGGANGGNGGIGRDMSAWRGESAGTTRYGGGGGGATAGGTGTPGTGGAGGGGNGQKNGGSGTAGSANTGGGGGGVGQVSGALAGLSGGSGIALVRFKI